MCVINYQSIHLGQGTDYDVVRATLTIDSQLEVKAMTKLHSGNNCPTLRHSPGVASTRDLIEESFLLLFHKLRKEYVTKIEPIGMIYSSKSHFQGIHLTIDGGSNFVKLLKDQNHRG